MWSFKMLQYVIICLVGDNMFIISNNGNKKLSKIDIHDIFVVADFDRTITTGSSEATFSLFSLSGYMEVNMSSRDLLYIIIIDQLN